MAPATDDPRRIRALAHPLRLRILDALASDGPQTATQLARALHQTPANMSFHLRTLAKYGYVGEAGGGQGRARPWQVLEQPQAEPDAVTAELVAREPYPVELPEEWRDKAFQVQVQAWLAPDEVVTLGRRIRQLVADTVEAHTLTNPENSAMVQVVCSGVPFGGFDGA